MVVLHRWAVSVFVALNSGNNLLYFASVDADCADGGVACGLPGSVSGRVIPAPATTAATACRIAVLMGIALRNDKAAAVVFDRSRRPVRRQSGRQALLFFENSVGTNAADGVSAHAALARYVFSAFRISTKFPFALFRSSRYIEHRSELLVYPALIPLEHWPKGADVGSR